jgi:hypothetical protein
MTWTVDTAPTRDLTNQVGMNLIGQFFLSIAM